MIGKAGFIAYVYYIIICKRWKFLNTSRAFQSYFTKWLSNTTLCSYRNSFCSNNKK